MDDNVIDVNVIDVAPSAHPETLKPGADGRGHVGIRGHLPDGRKRRSVVGVLLGLLKEGREEKL